MKAGELTDPIEETITEEQFISDLAEIFDILAKGDFEYKKENGLDFGTGSLDPASKEPFRTSEQNNN